MELALVWLDGADVFMIDLPSFKSLTGNDLAICVTSTGSGKSVSVK